MLLKGECRNDDVYYDFRCNLILFKKYNNLSLTLLDLHGTVVPFKEASP